MSIFLSKAKNFFRTDIHYLDGHESAINVRLLTVFNDYILDADNAFGFAAIKNSELCSSSDFIAFK